MDPDRTADVDHETPANALAKRRIVRALAMTGVTIAYERAWPWLCGAASLCALYLTLVFSGLLPLAPGWARMVVFGLATAAIGFALLMAVRDGRATLKEAMTRLDRASAALHRPVTAVLDRPAEFFTDPLTAALWRTERRRQEAALAETEAPWPRSTMAAWDPFALRFLLSLMVLAAALVAGPERGSRLATAFDWTTRHAATVPPRFDAWIDPPAYTSLPPIVIDLAGKEGTLGAPIAAPVGANLVLRASDATGVTAAPSAGLATEQGTDAQGNAPGREWRYTLKADARLRLETPTLAPLEFSFHAIPDLSPEVTLSGSPELVDGALTLAYRASDDYGLAVGEALISNPRLGGSVASGRKPPLVAAPVLPLALPADRHGGAARTRIEPTDSPWGGITVDLVVAMRDDPRQETRTTPIAVTLPQRIFTNLIARSLAILRRELVLDPDSRADVLEALDRLRSGVDSGPPEAGPYLGLYQVERDLVHAHTDTDLIAVSTALWDLALSLEERDQGDAKKALDAVREALKQAFASGAPPAEIKALADRLRDALGSYLKDYAARAARDVGKMDGMSERPSRVLRPEDLRAMIDRMEEFSRRGVSDDAERMLNALNDMLDALQAKPPRQANPAGQVMEQAVDDLDRMMRDERSLRDDTFRKGQSGAADEADPSSWLGDRQKTLQDQLNRLREALKRADLGEDPSLQDADKAMSDAQNALKKNANREAVEAQEQAIDGLRHGALGLARQLNGESEAQGRADRMKRGADGTPDDRDPLGRPSGRHDAGKGDLRQGGMGGSIERRARAVVEELRRRLGDPGRSLDERDYLNRLLGGDRHP